MSMQYLSRKLLLCRLTRQNGWNSECCDDNFEECRSSPTSPVFPLGETLAAHLEREKQLRDGKGLENIKQECCHLYLIMHWLDRNNHVWTMKKMCSYRSYLLQNRPILKSPEIRTRAFFLGHVYTWLLGALEGKVMGILFLYHFTALVWLTFANILVMKCWIMLWREKVRNEYVKTRTEGLRLQTLVLVIYARSQTII